MRIAIIGAGRIGSTLARLFAQAGHSVALSNSRGPDSLTQAVAEIGQDGEVRADTPAGAAESAELILLAVPWDAWEHVLPPEAAAGKIVVDAMNRFGGAAEPGSTERVAERLPGAAVVKAFNTMHWQELATAGLPGADTAERRAIFVAGDDPRARAAAVRLIDEIGFAAVETGGLRAGGALQQPGTALFNRPMSGAEGERIVAAQAGKPAS